MMQGTIPLPSMLNMYEGDMREVVKTEANVGCIRCNVSVERAT